MGLERCQPTAVSSPSQLFLERFADYLTTDRALRSATVSNYLNQTRPFLRWRAESGDESPTTLQAKEITNYLLWRGSDQTVGSVSVATTALRAFLASAFLVRVTPTDLTIAIGPIAHSSHRGLLKALNAEQLAALQAQAGRGESPRRNQVLVLVFSLWGLRSGEAAALCLEDIKWRLGTVLIHVKGGALQTMPLSADVGAALSDYLLHERPAATVAGTAFNDLLLRAYGRNHGGIVFEFNYVGVISPADSYADYQFVGSWSGVNLL